MSALPFSIDIVAGPEDIDELGHVSNVVYVRWVLQVAQAHSYAVGYDHAAYREIGAVFVVRRHEIDYLRPAHTGERIRLSTWIETSKAASSVRMTRIARLVDNEAATPGDAETSTDEVELCRGKTLWAFIDLASRRPRRIPKSVLAAFT